MGKSFNKKVILKSIAAIALSVIGFSSVVVEADDYDDGQLEGTYSQVLEGLGVETQAATGNTDAQVNGTEKIVSADITRYDGYSRENVAENVTKAHFGDSNKVIIVNRDKFSDAISATNISQGRYPVLYTHDDEVSESTLALIKSMALDEIYVLGGTLSVNEDVVNQLENASGVPVTRVAGRSRYDANVASVKENYTTAGHVVIASGEVYSDALYGVSYANTIDAPVVLAKKNHLEDSTISLLKEMNVKNVTIIGGPLSVTPDVEKHLTDMGISHNRIYGRNRYIGSEEVAKQAYDAPTNVVVASGETHTDALVSAPLAQKLDAPILLVKRNEMEDVVENYIYDNKFTIENIYLQGGELTIFNDVQNRIEDLTSYAVVTTVLPYDTAVEEDNTIPVGESEVTQEGVDGYEEVIYNLTYDGGVIINRVETDRNRVEPVNEVIKNGTRLVEENVIPFETIYEDDNTLLAGESVVVQEGVDGLEEIIYEVTMVDGEETDRKEIGREIVKEPVNKIVKNGTRIDIESVTLVEDAVALEEETTQTLTANVLPSEATNKELVWSSSDETVATVDETGKVTALKAGETIISVSDKSGEFKDQVTVTVTEPTIVSIEDITTTIDQFDSYTLPTTVSAKTSNGNFRDVQVSWDGEADTSEFGKFTFVGTVPDYADSVQLTLTINEYDPQVYTNAYASVTINNLARSIDVKLNNYGSKPVNIDKIELYERGSLHLTYLAEDLEESNISTIVNPGSAWGITISSKLGYWLDGTYVKYYISVDGTEYEYVDYL